MKEQFAIPEQLALALHDYLLTRPMREVEQLVVALRECAPKPDKDEEG